MSLPPWRCPPSSYTRSHSRRANDLRQESLNQLIAVALPLSNRLIAVRTAFNALYLVRPTRIQQMLHQELLDTFDVFNRVVNHFVQLFTNQNYYMTGDEITTAVRRLNKLTNRAEFLLPTLQNTNSVRRRLDFSYSK